MLDFYNKITDYLFGKNDTRFYYLSLIYENNRWTIHGLWPQNDKSDYPQFCKKVNFDPTVLDPIKSDLEKYWLSDRGKDDTFWEHEWKKHGSCYFENINELEYFQTTLNLFHKVTDMNIIENYKKNDKALIPFDLKLNLIKD